MEEAARTEPGVSFDVQTVSVTTSQERLRVTIVNTHLERRRISLDAWGALADFRRIVGATSAAAPWLDLTVVLAARRDEVREDGGVVWHFVADDPLPQVELPGGRVWRRIPRRLCRRVRSLAPALIHYEGLIHPRVIGAIKRIAPSAQLVAQDHAFRPPGWGRRWWFRRGLAHLDAVIFAAVDQARPLKTAGLLPAALPVFEVIEGSTSFEPGEHELARRTSGLTGDPCLFWLGALDANKDPLTILDAVALASRTLPNIALHMCYREAPLVERVRAKIAGEPSLASRVRLLGEIPYPGTEPYLQAADFLVQGSSHEACGYGVIEALACGTTPLVTDIPSFRRVTAGGLYGGLFAPGDARGLAATIVAWAQRDRGELRRAARQHFERALSFAAVGKELSEVYRRAYESHRSRRERSMSGARHRDGSEPTSRT